MQVDRDRCPDEEAARDERSLRQAIAGLTVTDLDQLQSAVRDRAWARALRRTYQSTTDPSSGS